MLSIIIEEAENYYTEEAYTLIELWLEDRLTRASNTTHIKHTTKKGTANNFVKLTKLAKIKLSTLIVTIHT